MAQLTEEFRGLESSRALLVEEPGASAFFVRLAVAVDDREHAGRAVAAAELFARDNPDFLQIAARARHACAALTCDRDGLAALIDFHLDPWVSGARHVPLPILDKPVTDGADRPILVLAEVDDIGDSSWQELTKTQRAVAELVGSGLTNRQVAKRMYLSPHTVNYHLRTIFRKLRVSSRVELVHHRYRSANQAQPLPPGLVEAPTVQVNAAS
jgi:DNA-binding CsgD family transcriptional regulator